MSALKNGPRGFQLGADRAALEAQQARIQNRMNKLGAAAPNKYSNRLSKVQSALANMPPDVSIMPVGAPEGVPVETPVSIGDVNQGSLNLINQGFGQAQNMWANNPMNMDYQTSRQQATDAAMNEFDRLNAGQYAREESAFKQEMAQRGIAPGSAAYENAYSSRISEPRANARQGALNNAFQLGQGEQSQMFNQAATQAQMPFQQLSYLSPFYNAQSQAQIQQGQQGFLAGQNALDRQQALDLQRLQGRQRMNEIRATPRGGGGGGGGLNYDQQLGLLDRQFYNSMVLNGLNGGGYPQQPSASNQFVQGIGSGIGMGLGAALRG